MQRGQPQPLGEATLPGKTCDIPLAQKSLGEGLAQLLKAPHGATLQCIKNAHPRRFQMPKLCSISFHRDSDVSHACKELHRNQIALLISLKERIHTHKYTHTETEKAPLDSGICPIRRRRGLVTRKQSVQKCLC